MGMDNFSVVGSFMLANNKENLNLDGCGTLAERYTCMNKMRVDLLISIYLVVVLVGHVKGFNVGVLWDAVWASSLLHIVCQSTSTNGKSFKQIPAHVIRYLVSSKPACSCSHALQQLDDGTLQFPLTLWIWIHVKMCTRFRMCACWTLLLIPLFSC